MWLRCWWGCCCCWRSWTSVSARRLSALDVLGKSLHLVVVVGPLAHDPARRVQLGLFGERVVAQVDALRGLLGGLVAPGLAPQPLLRQGFDRHLQKNKTVRGFWRNKFLTLTFFVSKIVLNLVRWLPNPRLSFVTLATKGYIDYTSATIFSIGQQFLEVDV